MDGARVDRGVLVATGSALLLVISLFLPWYAVVPSRGPGTFAIGATVTGWESVGHTDLLLFLVATITLAAAALTVSGTLPALPVPIGRIVLGAGLVALLLVLRWFVVRPEDADGLVGVNIDHKLGPFVALVAAAGIALGGKQAEASRPPARAI